MKIILSRKGFDMGSGHSPSPHIVETGELFSIPIPGDDSSRYSYKDLKFNDTMSCRDLMAQLKIKALDRHAHTDPDLRHDLFYDPDPKWRPLFGQHEIPQGHLRRQGVGKGDIFLFYGLFQDVKQTDGRYTFIGGTKKQVIWGYMEVGFTPIEVKNNSDGLLHPHFYLWDKYKRNNTVYEASSNLSFAPDVPGYGVFRFNDSLVLSRKCSDQCEIYNQWQLPLHFYEHRMTWNKDWRWSVEGDYCLLQAANRGQEFVISDNEKAEEWAKNLILSNACYLNS